MYTATNGIRRAHYRLLARFVMFFVNKLPDRVLLVIRSNSAISKKMDYEKSDIFLDITSQIEMEVRTLSCKKEPEIIDWIENVFKKGDIFFDIGANVGCYSLVASKFHEGEVKIYSFEPAFTNFPQLCKNVIANGCMDSVVPLQIALSNKTGIDTFNYHNLTPGGAIHTLGAPVDYKGDIFEPVLKQSVLSFRIDDLIKNFQIPIPNHIKIDVDGIEFDVLKGADEALESPEIKSIILELEEGSKEADTIIEYLAEKGLKFRSKHRYALGGDTGPLSKVYNYIFDREGATQ